MKHDSWFGGLYFVISISCSLNMVEKSVVEIVKIRIKNIFSVVVLSLNKIERLLRVNSSFLMFCAENPWFLSCYLNVFFRLYVFSYFHCLVEKYGVWWFCLFCSLSLSLVFFFRKIKPDNYSFDNLVFSLVSYLFLRYYKYGKSQFYWLSVVGLSVSFC